MISSTSTQTSAFAGYSENCRTPFALDLVHHLSGRLRLRSSALKGDLRTIERQRRQLAAITGVISAEANPDTGSLLLKYNPAVIPSEEIAQVLATHGIKVLDSSPALQSTPRFGDAIIPTIKRLLLEAMAERIVIALVEAAI